MFLWNVLRVYSWIFEAILCIMAIAVGFAALAIGSGGLVIGWIALQSTNQGPLLIGLGLVGLLSVFLAMAGRFRFLLFLFAVLVVYLLVKGLFLGLNFTFSGPEQAWHALLLTAGAILAMLGALPFPARRRR